MSTQHSGTVGEPACPPPDRKQLQRCCDVLEDIARAKDVNMLPSRHQSLFKDFSLSSVSAGGLSWQQLPLKVDVVPSMIAAMCHVMDLIAKGDGPSSLLEGSTACDVLANLSCDLQDLLHQFGSSDEVLTGASNGQWKQMTALGLLHALTKYSQVVVIPALDKLAAATDKLSQQQPTLQKQQQRLRIKRSEFIISHCRVAGYVSRVLALWLLLLRDDVASSPRFWQSQPGDTTTTSPLPIIIQLAATAVPLLSKGLSLADTSKTSTSKPAHADIMQPSQLDATALRPRLQNTYDAVLDVSESLCSTLVEIFSTGDSQCMLHLQQILLSERLVELLLMLLADSTEGLRLICLQKTDPATAEQSEPSDANTAQQQHKQQHTGRDSSVYQQNFFSSHSVLLTALGVPTAGQEPSDAFFRKAECSASLTVMNSIVRQYVAVSARHCGAACSNNSANEDCQQQLPDRRCCAVFPEHLMLPATKMLVEMAILLPSTNDLKLVDDCLELILLLLRLSTAANSQSGQPAGSKTEPQTCRTAAVTPTATGNMSAAAADVSWPVIPSATAAALLHPVLQLLSQAVTRMLREVGHRIESQPVSVLEALEANRQRRSLLHKYGLLLMCVCQPVEPKHITAVLKSDWPLVPILALDAVIRTNAVRGQQQQQFRPTPSATPRSPTGTNPTVSVTDHHTTQQTAAQYLGGFVHKAAQAIALLAQTPLQQLCAHFWGLLPSQEDTVPRPAIVMSLVMRLFVMAMTLHKVQQTAASRYMEHTSKPRCGVVTSTTCEGTEPPACLLPGTDVVVDIADALSKGIMALHSSTTSSRRYQDGNSTSQQQQTSDNSSADDIFAADTDANHKARHMAKLLSLPVVLLLRVISAASRQLLLESQSVTELAAAAHAGGNLLPSTSQSLSTLLFSCFSSLLSVVNMVDVAASMLKHLHGWQSGGPPVHDDAAVTITGSTSDPFDSTHEDNIEQEQAVWEQRQRQQLPRLQSLGYLGRTILAGCEGFRSPEQDIAGSTTSSSSQDNSTVAAARADWPAGSLDVDDSPGVVSDDARVGSDAAESVNDVSSRISAFCTQLNDVTLFVISQYPVPFCCNNPSCLNLFRLSEYQLVSGKACVCGGCRVARYCSRECQKKHWKMHKLICDKVPEQTVLNC